jgi:hypothetical protein
MFLDSLNLILGGSVEDVTLQGFDGKVAHCFYDIEFLQGPPHVRCALANTKRKIVTVMLANK